MTRKQLYILIATILGSGMVFLDGSVVNLALPHIGSEFKSGFSSLQWIVDGYLLSLSALLLIGGSLGDIYGQRRIYFTGLIGFGVVSLACALAPNAETLIGLRIAQGVFGALLVPSGLAIITTNFDGPARAVAIGRWTAFSAVVTALGPLVGGVLVDASSWRWIFLINVPLVIATLVMAKLGMSEHVGDRTRSVDFGGASLAMVSLAAVSYGLIEGSGHHWSVVDIATIIVGLTLMVVFVLYERRVKDPMMKMELFKSANFTAANITTFAMYGALGGFFFALTIYLQSRAGYSSFMAGASLLPVTVVMFGLSSRVGKWSATLGPRRFMTAGPIVAAGGIGLLGMIGSDAPYLTAVFPGVVLFSIGLALTVAPLTSTVMNSVKSSDSGIASGINNAISRVAGLIVIALLGLLGSEHVFVFAAVLCGSLAVGAGVVSWLMVRDDDLIQSD